MNHKYDFGVDPKAPIVYVRPILVEDLPPEVRQHVGSGLSKLYAVHDVDGQRLALVADRKLAFALARQHDFTPVNVH
ncbi:MAG: DUF1150 family protein [Rhodobacteraceae bacterium]|nr:DUF1150 family protein [Paracoccaceae bacterium]